MSAALLAGQAVAADAPASPAAAAPAGDPMAAWQPHMAAHQREDRKQIRALLRAWDEAVQKADLAAAAALVDFPVLMATDDQQGNAITESWDREKWGQRMAPFFKPPPADAKATHDVQIDLITDALATVQDESTMKLGKKKVTFRNASLVVRKQGAWLVKSMVEGGWGDAEAMRGAGAVPPPAPAASAPPAEPKGPAKAEKPKAPEKARAKEKARAVEKPSDKAAEKPAGKAAVKEPPTAPATPAIPAVPAP
jgi:hypothetical protein